MVDRCLLLRALCVAVWASWEVSGGIFGSKNDNSKKKKKKNIECELYLADSTIPGAGIGIFSGVSKAPGDPIGNGDKAIPLVDAYWHNGHVGEDFFNPTSEYVWDGTSMGMRLELFDPNDISAFWPGIDAMVNAHSGLLNVDKATPVYDEGGIHRSKHPGAGSVSPYDAGDLSSVVTRTIPAGGELFKSYGENWFLHRYWLGQIPLQSDYERALWLLNETKLGCHLLGFPPSNLYDEVLQPMKQIWDSRTLNAWFDFGWEDAERALEAEDFGILLQPNATRSLEWLNEHGKCLDHIVHQRSTIDGAGAGAFAKRDLPKGTIVTGTPLLVFPDKRWFHMYDFQLCPDGSMARNTTNGPYGQQLLLNYCFGHHESNVVLCPYGSGVNYINHNQTRANVRIRWAQDGVTGHQEKFLHKNPRVITDYSTKVAFDYVATRDIAEGEELFLDYGEAWEAHWKKHHEDWYTYDRAHLDEYVSAAEYNARYAHDALYTSEELRSYNPHPDNLSMRCHHLLDEESLEGVFAWDGDPAELAIEANWHQWTGDNSGLACEVLERLDSSYVVRYERKGDSDPDQREFRIVSRVPREAIKFFDIPYSTDMHMMGAFRHAIGIPDDMLPDAWRKTDGDEEDKADHATEDACARNPYRKEEEEQQHPQEDEQQQQYESPALDPYSTRVRRLRSHVRGVSVRPRRNQ